MIVPVKHFNYAFFYFKELDDIGTWTLANQTKLVDGYYPGTRSAIKMKAW